jgi:hypothetical protein
MKKLFLLSLLLVGTLSSVAQDKSKPKIKDIDRDINVLLDSLSKVYKKKVFSIMKITKNDTIKTYISYEKDNKLTYELISSKRIN